MSQGLCKPYTVYILPTMFERFNDGKPIKVKIYYNWEIEIGEILEWCMDDKKGVAKIVALSGPKGNRMAMIIKVFQKEENRNV